MLESFRKLERSWTTYVMFFIICAMFVVGYMPCIGQNIPAGATGATVAHVGNHSIGHNLVNISQGALSLDRQYDLRFFNPSRSMFFQLGNGGQRITEDERANAVFNQSLQDAAPLHVEKVVNDLIEVYLVSDLALSMGLDVSEGELATRIRSARIFQTQTGTFGGRRSYERQLSRYGLNPEDFENFFKRLILRGRVVDLYKAMHRPDAAEIQFYLSAMTNKVNLEFLQLDRRPLAAFLSDGLSEGDVADYAKKQNKKIEEAYKAPRNKIRYHTPEKMSLRGIWINPDISTDRDKDKAKVKVDQIRKEIDDAFQAGGGTHEALVAAFEKAAQEHSDHIDSKENRGAFKDPKSKEALGRYPFGDKDGAELIFSAKPGDLVGPIETRFGFWLVMAGEHIASVTVPLEDVALDLARELLGQEKAAEQFESVVAEILTKAKANGASGLNAVTEAWSKEKGYKNNVFPSQKTGPFGRIGEGPLPPRAGQLEYIPYIGNSEAIMDQAFALTAEASVAPIAFAVEGEESRFIVRLHERATDEEATVKEKREAIRGQLQIHNASLAYRGMVVDMFQKAQKSQPLYTNLFHQMRQSQLKALEDQQAGGIQ